MIVVRPFRQVLRRVNKVLNAMDHHRAWARRYVQHSFHPQHVGAVAVQQHGQPDAESRPIQRLRKAQAEGVDLRVVAIDVGMLMLMRAGGYCLGLKGKPTAHFVGPAGKIIEIARQQRIRMDEDIWRYFQLRRGRIESSQVAA